MPARRASTPVKGSTSTASPCRSRSRRPDQATLGRRRTTSARPRSSGSGRAPAASEAPSFYRAAARPPTRVTGCRAPPGHPAGQRGPCPDGPEGRMERRRPGRKTTAQYRLSCSYPELSRVCCRCSTPACSHTSRRTPSRGQTSTPSCSPAYLQVSSLASRTTPACHACRHAPPAS